MGDPDQHHSDMYHDMAGRRARSKSTLQKTPRCTGHLGCLQSLFCGHEQIYRAYIVWNRNLWLVALPIGLLAGSFIVNIYVLVWLRNPPPFGPISFSSGLAAFNSVYIIAFVQNFLTTSLLTLKIWTQHRQSQAAGALDQGGRVSLIRVARIIVESAMVYTLQLLIIIVLNFRHNNGQYVVQCAIVPSIGEFLSLPAATPHVQREEHQVVFLTKARLFALQLQSSCAAAFYLSVPNLSPVDINSLPIV